ncbi:hypothetical protein GCM10011369_26110 [Neiella marina]|uniref:Uncharacterized protein n=1 Tax=Neiella marina TaxID=508461 RepID=A0A8J2U6T0_9GAMM|nr:hypothetical protein [Neiella marina]GGA82890.1 hypothetical protein GCM10011369_26110 [Neiella marina]
MTRADQQEAGNRRRFMTIICVLLMLLLIYQVNRMLSEQHSDWHRSVFVVVERDFQVAVAHIYAEARLQGKVTEVALWQRLIRVNDRGRPAVFNAEGLLQCEVIWQQVMGVTLDSMAMPVTVVGLNRLTNGKSSQGCRFLVSENDYFDYFP